MKSTCRAIQACLMINLLGTQAFINYFSFNSSCTYYLPPCYSTMPDFASPVCPLEPSWGPLPRCGPGRDLTLPECPLFPIFCF